jgi:hypothetical protein
MPKEEIAVEPNVVYENAASTSVLPPVGYQLATVAF